MDRLLEDFLTRLNAAPSSEDTWRETLTFLQSFGFDVAMYAYSRLPSAGQALRHGGIFTNYADWFLQRYQDQGYAEHDPAARHTVESLTPRLIGLNSLPCWPNGGRDFSDIQHGITNEAADCGLKIGLIFPLRSQGNCMGGISMSNSMELAEFEKFLADRKFIVHMAAACAHTRLQMQLTSERAAQVHLTPREHEALLWTALGRSSKSVARKMSVHPKTVDLHLLNAMRKLKAATRTHAVARAIALGLINP